MRNALLFPGDELTIYDEFPDSRIPLAKYLTFNSSASKIISLSNTVSIELTSAFNFSLPSLSNDSRIFTFNFTLEVAGFCSSDHPDRASCGSSELQRCYSTKEDRCDGVWDCPLTGRDEIGCSCPFSSGFACADFAVSGTCYGLAQRCDGVHHCADKSDEMDCLESQCSLEALRFLCLPLNTSVVPNTTVLQAGECIPLDHICDDHIDCSNGVDESPELCRASTPSNSSSSSPPSTFIVPSSTLHRRLSLIAQLFARQVAREAVHEAAAAALGRIDSRLRTLLTYVLSALLGPLLIVLTIGLICRSSASSAAAGRRSAEETRRARLQARFNSPIQRLIREEIRRRPPPPTYEEALNNSLFEEPMLEGAAPPPAPPLPPPGALSQDRVAAVREMSMKPAPTRVDVSISCNLLSHGVTSSPSSSRSTSSTAAVIQIGGAVPGRFNRREPSIVVGNVDADGDDGSSVDGSNVSSASGLLHRWFLSALNGWRRGTGSGGTNNESGGINPPSGSNAHNGSNYEQPEVSEATVVSSMHEEEEEDDEDNDDDEEENANEEDGDRNSNGDDEYASISSRPNSMGGEDGSQFVEHGNAGTSSYGPSSSSGDSATVTRGEDMVEARALLIHVGNSSVANDVVDNSSGQRTPLLNQGNSAQQPNFAGNY
ncbi:hypothetical protein Aperf_G00000120326 [Anoplocephala perfoliata]